MITLTRAAQPTLTVLPGAIAANLATIGSRTNAAVMAVVKGDGYGHGAVAVARAAVAAGATWLGVTRMSEAIELRTHGLGVPILSWLNPGGLDAGQATRWDVDLGIGSAGELLELLASARGRDPVRVHLHADTGMAREGCPAREWPELTRLAADAHRAGRIRVVGLMGHLPLAESADPTLNAPAVAAMAAALRGLTRAGIGPVVTHLAATAGALTDPRTHGGLVRVGAGLVGIDPSGTTRLAAAARLTAPILHTAEAAAGTAVGYGGTYRTRSRTHLATLGIGYADGIPRRLSPAACVEVDGSRYPIVGRVSMDQIILDTGPHRLERGRIATVFGPAACGTAPTIAEWAAWAGTIPHDIVTRIGPRIARSIE